MSTEENKAIVRRFVDEVQSGGDIEILDELCSPDFINHSASPGMPAGCEGVKLVTTMFRQAFPDSYFTVEDMIAEGDKVVTRKTFHGTHEGEFMGIPPTRRRVSMWIMLMAALHHSGSWVGVLVIGGLWGLSRPVSSNERL